MNTIDITTIISAVVALFIAAATGFLIPWIKSKTSDAQRKELIAWTKIAVAAAEQRFQGQGRGQEKKQQVIAFLKSKGFKIDEESINTIIEAAVKQLNTAGLQLE